METDAAQVDKKLRRFEKEVISSFQNADNAYAKLLDRVERFEKNIEKSLDAEDKDTRERFQRINDEALRIAQNCHTFSEELSLVRKSVADSKVATDTEDIVFELKKLNNAIKDMKNDFDKKLSTLRKDVENDIEEIYKDMRIRIKRA